MMNPEGNKMSMRNKTLVGIVIIILAIHTGIDAYFAGRNLLIKYQVDAFNKGVAAAQNSIVSQIRAEGQLRVNVDGKIVILKREGEN